MATIKISELNSITQLNSNTSNVFLVGSDLQSGITGGITGKVLANGLYANNALNVGNNAIILPNVAAQFAATSGAYIQTNLVNLNNAGTADHVVSANTGTDTTYYLDVGYSNKDYVPGTDPNSLGNSISALDGYLYVQGKAGNPGGNLVVGTTSSNTEVRVIVGGGTSSNVVAKLSPSAITLNRTLVFGDGTTQNTSVQSTANNAVAAFTKANAAFDKANGALANTTGLLSGSLTVTGNVISYSSMRINNQTMAGNNEYLIITGTLNNVIGTPTNPGYTIHTATDSGNRIVGEAYSNTATDYVGFIGRRARGRAQSPLGVQTGDLIARFGGNAYGTSKFSQFADSRIDFVAVENHTDASKGTQITFWTTASGSNTATQIATFNGTSATFTGKVSPQKGFIYTPRVLAGAQTAITIDYSSDSMVRATFNSALTISHTNYESGKIVEVWLTNTAGNGQTINHGCLANNSTIGATSFTIPAGSSAYLKYFSIDGDSANTFVNISHA